MHDEYKSGVHIGEYNFNSIQLISRWWGDYIEQKFLAGQEHICWFMASMFRLIDKYVLRGGLGHVAKMGNKDIDAFLLTTSKIEKASLTTMKQPDITFMSPKQIRTGSWENRFEYLAVDMVLHPEKYPKGHIIKTEKDYASPIVLTALKMYIQTLERGVSYEIKRKVISKLKELEDSIDNYIKELDEKIDSTFLSVATKINDSAKKINEIDRVVNTKIEGLKGKINLVLKKQMLELEARYNFLVELSDNVDKMVKELGEKKLFQGFMGRKNLKKLLKKVDV